MAKITLVFDAGDTLISVTPEFTGPMANWPRLEAVPGVGEMLAELNGRFRLVVGSNATDSDALLVRAAMQRLGLDGYFSDYFTPAELHGTHKPHPAYFLEMEQRLRVLRSELVMVGDSYDNDVVGSVQAGWRSVWYNPTGKAAPGLAPQNTAEITRLIDLPRALDSLDLPPVNEAYVWLAEQGAGTNLMTHVTMVAALAYQLAVWLRQTGEFVDPVLAHRGGLLHDLAKGPAKAQQVDHGRLAAQMLMERGQPELAEIADRHVLFNLLNEDRTPRTWEEKLVYYADKLVERRNIVNFRQRLAAMRERYRHPAPEEEMDRLISAVSYLEGDICRRLDWTPEQLLEQLRLAYSEK